MNSSATDEQGAPPALRLREVTVGYGADDPVVEQLSLTLAAGERAALVGLNGAGKTSLLTALVGLMPHDGVIEIGGVPVEPSRIAEVRKRVGFLFNAPEDQLLFPRVVDDVAFGLRARGRSVNEASAQARRALALLDVEALAEDSVTRLSHGQKQRVALAGALVHEPSLLLLDEPSANLDPPGKRRLASRLKSLAATMLVATHDLDFADLCCDRFLLLQSGGLALDTPDSQAIRARWDALDTE